MESFLSQNIQMVQVQFLTTYVLLGKETFHFTPRDVGVMGKI